MKKNYLNIQKTCVYVVNILALSFSTVVNADSYTELTSDLHSCSQIGQKLKRVACYDEIAENHTLDKSVKPKEIKSTSSEVTDFGIAKIESTLKGEPALIDEVVEIKEYSPNKRLITLSSGQVWKQMLSGRFLVREKDSIKIYKKGGRKNYTLSVEGRKASIQVERIR